MRGKTFNKNLLIIIKCYKIGRNMRFYIKMIGETEALDYRSTKINKCVWKIRNIDLVED